MADIKTKQFFGTAQTLMSITTDTSAGNFTAAGGTLFDNTSDASVPYATHGLAVLEFAMAVSVTDYSVLELWGLMQNVDSTSDETDAPATTARNGARWLASFVVSSGTSLQRRSAVIDLAGVKGFEAYIKNTTGQALNNDTTTLSLKVTPFTYGVTTA